MHKNLHNHEILKRAQSRVTYFSLKPVKVCENHRNFARGELNPKAALRTNPLFIFFFFNFLSQPHQKFTFRIYEDALENTCELAHRNLHSKILTWSLVKLRGIVNPWFLPAVMNIIIFWSTPTQIRYQRLNKVVWSIRHSRIPQRNILSCPGSPFNHSEFHLIQNIPQL